jgi:uncharacterized PurR-regulated membrane protein YhhQ (DUF165 family)
MRPLLLVAYVGVFAAASIVTAHTMPAEVGPFLVTWGTWIIGVTFVLRDAVHLAYGKRTAYLAIAGALVIAAVTSALLGDPLAIVLGSALAIAISESLDTEVFARWRGRLSSRIAISGLIGSVFDSVVFVLVALSPWTTGIVPWDAIPNVIAGQILAKGAVQLIAAAVVRVGGR